MGNSFARREVLGVGFGFGGGRNSLETEEEEVELVRLNCLEAEGGDGGFGFGLEEEARREYVLEGVGLASLEGPGRVVSSESSSSSAWKRRILQLLS